MPIVPTQTQQIAPMPAQRSAAPALAFGIGSSGLDKLASSLKDVSKAALAIQAEDDSAAAKSSLNDLDAMTRELQYSTDIDQETGKPKGYMNLSGKDAIDAYETAMKTLENRRQELQSGLSNDRQKNLFNDVSRGTISQVLNAMTVHRAREQKTYINDVSNATIRNAAANAVTNYGSDQFVMNIDEGKAEIAGKLRRNGVEDPTVVSQELRTWESGVYADIAGRMLANGNVAGAQRFYRENAGRFFGNDATKMEHTLTAARRDADAQQERAEAKARAEQAKIVDREVNTAFVRIRRGDPEGYGIIQDLVDRNVIGYGDDHWRTLTLQADAAHKETIEREGLVTVAHEVGAGRAVADPNDPRIRKGADLALERDWAELPKNPYERNAELARLVGNYRFIPNRIAGEVRALQAGSPEQQIVAADLFAQLQEVNPTLVETTFGKTDAYRAELLTSYRRGGLSPEEAVKKVDALLSPANQQYVRERDERLKQEIRDAKGQPKIAAKDVVGWFDPGVLSFEPGASADVSGLMVEQANDAYRRAFLAGLDDTGAKAAAQREIKAQWGITELNGGKTIMRYPPEALFGPGSSDWMKRQLDHDVAARFEQMKAPGETLSRVQIVADPGRTSRGFSTGKPEYVVVAQTSSGELRPLGYWTPNLAAQRALDAAVAARDTADELATAEARQARADDRLERARRQLEAAEKSGNPTSIAVARRELDLLNPEKPKSQTGPTYGAYAEGSD